MADIENRIKEVPKKDLQKIIYSLVNQGKLTREGSRTYRTYSLAEKKEIKKKSKKDQS